MVFTRDKVDYYLSKVVWLNENFVRLHLSEIILKFDKS